MAMDGINWSQKLSNEQLNASANSVQTRTEATKQNFIPLNRGVGNDASKRITDTVIEHSLNQPSARKSVNMLLSNSPVGLGNQPSDEDIESMGYQFSLTAMHIGAPKIFTSSDGGTITVYDGKGTAEMGEDKRKIVYQNGRYTQEMYYDENGKLTQGKMVIKDKIAGFTEQQYDFIMKGDKIETVIK